MGSTAGASAALWPATYSSSCIGPLDYARWVVTSWFTTDQRFEAPDFTQKVTIDPFDKDSLWQSGCEVEPHSHLLIILQLRSESRDTKYQSIKFLFSTCYFIQAPMALLDQGQCSSLGAGSAFRNPESEGQKPIP